MKNFFNLTALALAIGLTSCTSEDKPFMNQDIVFDAYSTTPNFLKLESEFSDVNIYPILSSEDNYLSNFVYGSMADGAGLIKNNDGTYALINNIERDWSIARITLDETFKPIKGEYIVNGTATANTAMCSGSMITNKEHGFGPLYLSGGEWGGSSKGVFMVDPNKKASEASFSTMLNGLGQWSTENAVAIGKDAYADKTVVFIGDDHSDNNIPSGQLGMYVGERGDLYGGKLYGLKVTSAGINYEMDMEEGETYNMEFVELTESGVSELDAEAKTKGVMGFSRLEDIDWRRGSAKNNRELYFCVTGRKKDGLIGKGTLYGRIYKVVLNNEDPTKPGTITCVLDGDKLDGKAKAFHSPDNIMVTENYAYIQEDPNGYFEGEKNHYARLYQYNLNNGTLKTVLECDQQSAADKGYGTTSKSWEITGMIDISETIDKEAFLIITQNHGWEKEGFTDPNATDNGGAEGSVLHVITGLDR